MFCVMSSLYHHFIGMQRGQTRGEFLSVEKIKFAYFRQKHCSGRKKAYDKASILKRNKERNRENGRTKKMEEFYRKLKVGTKLKYAFTTVIVTLAIAVVVSLVSIVKMNVDTYKFYKEAYANSTLQMEIRKDIQLVGKYILWSMTTDDTGSTQSYLNSAQKYADQVGKMLPH